MKAVYETEDLAQSLLLYEDKNPMLNEEIPCLIGRRLFSFLSLKYNLTNDLYLITMQVLVFEIFKKSSVL
jgi:hypothetical protein